MVLEQDYNGYPIRQVFKHLGSGQYIHWDGNGRRTMRWDKLLHAISEVLGKD